MVTDASVCSVPPFHAPGRNADLHPMMGVVETLEGAALAAIDAIERWAEFDFGYLKQFGADGAKK